MVRKKTYIGKRLKNHKKKFQASVEKRREEMREIRKRLKEQKNVKEKLDQLNELYEEECRKRKKAERIANNYYWEWRAEREAKDEALENQINKPSSLPDSFYIKSSLLHFDVDGNGEEIIGAGVFGTVKLCLYKGSIVAAKCFEESGEETVAATKRSILKEAKVLLNLKSHNSIPTLLGVCLDEEPNKIILQLYQIERKSITLNLLCKQHENAMLSEGDWHSLINDLAKAINHVHMCGYLHNDIKTDNVVIYKSATLLFQF
ncbi:seven transmembrane domain-containing tyrosine-protein kinase 1 [Exaiptasia diaphana]|uniref:Protein kinase domain-containing protein n=1 Tax=Exaiptasia diaphana TaxID=2652724 RepID=A0A913Y5H8_EXADI|nr:seven transmembrane domain-containing tyrosine-protein kinase 1 [Exaiptasia diaphana]